MCQNTVDRVVGDFYFPLICISVFLKYWKCMYYLC